MYNKIDLKMFKKCQNTILCKGCRLLEDDDTCVLEPKLDEGILTDTALQLTERVEKLEQLLRDVLVSGNIKSCERAIREFLKEDNKC